MTSVLPWPQAGCEGDEEAWVGLDIQRPDMGEWDRQARIEDEAVPIDPSASADRVQILPLTDDDGAREMANLGMVPEGVAFDRGLAGAGRDPAAVATARTTRSNQILNSRSLRR